MDQAHDEFGELWERVVDDMEATAEEYRDEGWTVTTCHVGDVTALPAGVTEPPYDRIGLDAMLPGDEYRELRGVVDEHAFDEYETYRAETGSFVFLVLAMRDTDADLAVLVPLFYATTEAESMLDAAREQGEFHTYLRPLDDSSRIVFDHEDPSAFFPEAE